MIKKGFIAVVIAIVLLSACSKIETQANFGKDNLPPTQDGANLTAQSPDYKLICERLAALAPTDRKAPLAANCVTEYQRMLPSCQNAPAVNTCYANLKDWSGRLACLDSCVRK